MRILNRLAIVASAALVVSSSQVTSQPANPLPLVAVAVQQAPEGAIITMAAFRRGMEELGYIEGQNIRYEFRYANNNRDLRAPVAAEIAALAADVIVTTPDMGPLVAEATSTIPIVVANMSGIVEDALRALLQTNITGTKLLPGGPGQAGRMALAMELVPVATKVGFLYDPVRADGEAQRAAAEATASALGIAIVVAAVQAADGMGAAAQALIDQGVNVIVTGVGAPGSAQLMEVARTARIPVVHSTLSNVLNGGLVVWGTNNDLLFHGAAALVDQILRGANPAAVPFAVIDGTVLAVNLTAAAEIGFTFPPAVVARADQVIN